MKKVKRTLFIVLILVMLVVLAGCDKNEQQNTANNAVSQVNTAANTEKIPNETLKLAQGGSISEIENLLDDVVLNTDATVVELAVGQSYDFAQLTSEDISSCKIDDETIITITENGVITAIKEGTAMVTNEATGMAYTFIVAVE